ncbi:ABC transporter substrate-binding protein [Saccharopolyspora sp. K220]|uniref:ABC transporter substrate-binding protein n=1 Tax=Saccharopolyspora soli TaxID=2926618 RepID=UPI001F5612D4|nr:ABC transporter substrate-binding protein [Saccharopolyspora soli]MCI2423764.1 ABC transporter substrate-binding protein [Saccharopolyspora soli]
MTRRRVLTALLCCLSSVLAACGWGETSSAGALTIGILPTDSCSTVLTAQHKGFFTDAGLTVDVKSISSGSAISSGVVGGSIAIGCSSVGSIASAYQNGVPVRVVSQGAIYTASAPTSALMVATDSPIQSAKDLNGRTVAVNALKNVTQFATQAWVDKNGGDASTLKFIELPFSQMGAALQADRVDAALIGEPDLSRAQQEGQVRLLGNAYDAIGDNFSISTFFASASWAEAHRDALAKFRAALARAAEYSNSHQAETAKILADFSGIPADVAMNMKRAVWEKELNEQSMQPPLDVAIAYGGLSARVRFDDFVAK